MRSQSPLVLFIHYLSYFAPTIFRLPPRNELAQDSFPDDVSQESFASQLDLIFSSNTLSTYGFKIYLIC